MTANDFLEELTSRGRVRFGDALVEAPTEAMALGIADTLRRALPGDAQIRYAVQMEWFQRDTWQGQLVWLLVLKTQLLQLTVTTEFDAPAVDTATRFTVTIRIGQIKLSYSSQIVFELPPRRGAAPSGARLEFSLAGETMTAATPALSLAVVGDLHRALLEAAA